MNVHRLLLALTFVNMALLMFTLARPGAAGVQDIVPVLRGRALEIVDGQGKVRASITVFANDPTVRMPDGTTGYPETVLLRLIDSRGQPNVKIEATELGAGAVFGGESDPTHVQILAERGRTSMKLTNKDGRTQTLKP